MLHELVLPERLLKYIHRYFELHSINFGEEAGN